MVKFNKIKKNNKKEAEKKAEWEHEKVKKFVDFCRENKMVIAPSLEFTTGGIKPTHEYIKLSDEQVREMFPKIEYKSAEQNAEEKAEKEGELPKNVQEDVDSVKDK